MGSNEMASIEMSSATQLLERNVPDFSIADIHAMVFEHYNLDGEFKPLVSERDQGFRFTAVGGEQFVFKISNAQEDPNVIDFQNQALLQIQKRAPELPVPRIIPAPSGDIAIEVNGKNGDKHLVRLLSFLPGVMIAENLELNTKGIRTDLGKTVAKLDIALRGFFHSHARNVHPWDMMNFMVHRPHTQHIANEITRKKVEDAFDYAQMLLPTLEGLRHQVIHQDAHGRNVLLSPEQPDYIAGIIDFGDMLYGPLIMELVVACDLSMHRADDPVGHMCDIIAGFDSVLELEEQEIDLLYDLILVRNCVSITVCAWRAAMTPQDEPYFADIDLYGALLDRLVALGREKVTSEFRAACRFPIYSPSIGDSSSLNQNDEQLLLAKRQQLLGTNAWYFYEQPLHFERASGPWLYGVDGKAYLDLYNNVTQVGHCHPHVSRAIGRQARVLNTNTRYMYGNVLEYAERLVALMPDHLSACMFFNSGSEANDIALQMARVITGNQGAVVVEDAYHGISDLTQGLSPCSRPQLPLHVATLGVPCPYRGPHAGKADIAQLYAMDADSAINQLAERGIEPACFMVDTAYCSSGVVDVPDGYLALVEEKIRAAGGLVVADEVQAGFGRLGQMWGHEARGLKADIVTMGKPVGNGHPLGVLVTSKAILNHFIDETDLFSTFGGNPVSCAAGMAVLDVIENENLLDNANSTGDYLRDQLRTLAETQLLIGDVRGQGMLGAVEFVTDRGTKVPASEQTAQLLELMREQGVLVGCSGPLRNSLKLRPPLVFKPEHVDIFIRALDKSLSRLS